MMLDELMAKKKISKYRLSKSSGIPYTTLTDILAGKTALAKSSAETVYKLAKELDVPMEELLAPYLIKRGSFELFKSTVCHRLKELGDIDFLIETLERDDIREYYRRGWYPESLYVLAMLDYLSRVNGIPLCVRYDDLRHARLESVIYPSSVLAMALSTKDERIKEEARNASIPEFLRFNIVESEVRNVA
jgi:transcriptional regulator with XRE-family HTH domain